MRFYTQQHRFYAGGDRHARTLYLHVLDADGRTCFDQNLPARPDAFPEGRRDLVVRDRDVQDEVFMFEGRTKSAAGQGHFRNGCRKSAFAATARTLAIGAIRSIWSRSRSDDIRNGSGMG